MNEYVNTVVIIPPSATHQLSATTTTTEISPLTHSQSSQQFNNFSQNKTGHQLVNMETSSRNLVSKIILDFILMGTRKQKLIRNLLNLIFIN